MLSASGAVCRFGDKEKLLEHEAQSSITKDWVPTCWKEVDSIPELIRKIVVPA